MAIKVAYVDQMPAETGGVVMLARGDDLWVILEPFDPEANRHEYPLEWPTIHDYCECAFSMGEPITAAHIAEQFDLPLSACITGARQVVIEATFDLNGVGVKL